MIKQVGEGERMEDRNRMHAEVDVYCSVREGKKLNVIYQREKVFRYGKISWLIPYYNKYKIIFKPDLG